MALSFLLSFSAYLLLIGVEGQSSGQLRLVARNGQTSSSLTAGRLEVYYNGQWGTVCDDQFGSTEAEVACRQLGFSDNLYDTNVGFTSSSFATRFTQASSSTPIWFDSLSCSLSNSRLIDCASNIGSHNCAHSEDVVLFCEGNGAVRLSTSFSSSFISLTSSAGRVEVYYNGEWGTVCDDSFGRTDADVVCQQLGYPSSSTFGSVGSLGYSQGSGTIWLTNLACTSSDLMLSTCSSSGFGNTLTCSHSEDVAVSCNTLSSGQSSGQLRLVARNGQTSSSLTAGRLEVYYSGRWGTVCDDQFGSTEAEVACRQLGFSDNLYDTNVGSTSSSLATRFTQASSSTPIWFDSLSCSFSDSRLIDCASNIGVHNCAHSEDVVLFCEGNGAVRLSTSFSTSTTTTISSLTSSAGRVEVYYNGVWGTVCDDSFGQTDADVACRQLGYASASRYGSVGSLGYSQGSGTIWLDDLGCTSSDLMLSTCSHSGFGNENCGHSEDVAISCGTSLTPTSSTDFTSGVTSAVIAGIVIAVLVPLCFVGICVTVVVIAVCTGACAATSSSRNRRSNIAMTTIPAATATATVVTSTGAKTDFGGGKSNDPPPPYNPYSGTIAAYPTQGQAAPAPYPQAGNVYLPQPGYPAEQQQPPYPTDGSELQQYPAADPQVYPPQTGGGYPPPQAAQQASYPVEAGQLPQHYPADPAYPPQPYPAAGYPPPTN